MIVRVEMVACLARTPIAYVVGVLVGVVCQHLVADVALVILKDILAYADCLITEVALMIVRAVLALGYPRVAKVAVMTVRVGAGRDSLLTNVALMVARLILAIRAFSRAGIAEVIAVGIVM